jgi:hypothetical protein
MPQTPPAICLSSDGFTYGAPGAKMAFAAGATVYAKLDTTSDVSSTAWQVANTDDSTTPGSFTLSPTGVVQSQVSFVGAGLGSAGILQAQVNAGQDVTTQTYNPATTTATVKWVVLAANGLEVICFDEHAESGPLWWLPLLNAAIRNAATGTIANPSYAPVDGTVPLRGTSADLLAAWFAVTSGSTLAGSGALRLTSAAQSAVAAQSEVNAAHDVALLGVDGADGVIVGGIYAAKVALEVGSNQLAWDGANLLWPGGGEVQGGGGNVTIATADASIALTAAGQLTLTSTGLSLAGAHISSELLFRSDQTPYILQATLLGTGANPGAAMTFQGQTGQAQTGAAANNNGGAVLLAGGGAGTGGSGAAGLAGDATVGGDSVTLQGEHSVIVEVATVLITANTTGLGFFGAAPVAQQTRAGQLIDSTTGSNQSGLADGGAAYSQTITNNNNKTVLARLNALDLAVHNLGLTG